MTLQKYYFYFSKIQSILNNHLHIYSSDFKSYESESIIFLGYFKLFNQISKYFKCLICSISIHARRCKSCFGFHVRNPHRDSNPRLWNTDLQLSQTIIRRSTFNRNLNKDVLEHQTAWDVCWKLQVFEHFAVQVSEIWKYKTKYFLFEKFVAKTIRTA